MKNDLPLPTTKETLPVKKAYSPPQLQRFGSICEITQNIVGGSGKNDNQGGGNEKTNP